MRASLRLCLALAALATATGCPLVRSITRPSRGVKPNAIGVALPLTGRFQKVGEMLLEGIRMGAEGTALQLSVVDTASDPATAARRVDDLAAAGVVAILGGVDAEESRAAAERAEALGVPLVTFSKADDLTGVGSFVFRNMPTLKQLGSEVGRYATCELGLRRFAVLGPETDFARELTAAFEGAVGAGGGQVTAREVYLPGQTTFTPQAKRLTGRFEPEARDDYQAGQKEILAREQDPFRRRKALEKLRSGLPPRIDYQAVFLADGWETVSLLAPALAAEDLVTQTCDKDELERIQKTLGRSPLQTATLLGWGGWASPPGPDGAPQLVSRGGRSLECAVYLDAFFPGASRTATRQLVAASRRLKTTPTLFHALGFDTARVVAQVLGGAPEASGFRDALAALQGFEGATGTLSMNEAREVNRSLFALQVEGGTVKERPRGKGCGPPSALSRRGP